jgi:hypothetical protein
MFRPSLVIIMWRLLCLRGLTHNAAGGDTQQHEKHECVMGLRILNQKKTASTAVSTEQFFKIT